MKSEGFAIRRQERGVWRDGSNDHLARPTPTWRSSHPPQPAWGVPHLEALSLYPTFMWPSPGTKLFHMPDLMGPNTTHAGSWKRNYYPHRVNEKTDSEMISDLFNVTRAHRSGAGIRTQTPVLQIASLTQHCESTNSQGFCRQL